MVGKRCCADHVREANTRVNHTVYTNLSTGYVSTSNYFAAPDIAKEGPWTYFLLASNVVETTIDVAIVLSMAICVKTNKTERENIFRLSLIEPHSPRTKKRVEVQFRVGFAGIDVSENW